MVLDRGTAKTESTSSSGAKAEISIESNLLQLARTSSQHILLLPASVLKIHANVQMVKEPDHYNLQREQEEKKRYGYRQNYTRTTPTNEYVVWNHKSVQKTHEAAGTLVCQVSPQKECTSLSKGTLLSEMLRPYLLWNGFSRQTSQFVIWGL